MNKQLAQSWDSTPAPFASTPLHSEVTSIVPCYLKQHWWALELVQLPGLTTVNSWIRYLEINFEDSAAIHLPFWSRSQIASCSLSANWLTWAFSYLLLPLRATPPPWCRPLPGTGLCKMPGEGARVRAVIVLAGWTFLWKETVGIPLPRLCWLADATPCQLVTQIQSAWGV